MGLAVLLVIPTDLLALMEALQTLADQEAGTNEEITSSDSVRCYSFDSCLYIPM